MIKKIFFVSIIISSCSLIEPRDIPAVMKSLVVGIQDIEVNNAFYESMPYSFAKLKIGKSHLAILVLLSINNDVYEWIGPNGERVFTQSGKIIQTIGLQHNLKIVNSNNINTGCSKCSHRSYIQLLDPPAFVTQHLKNRYSHNESIMLNIVHEASVYTENYSTSKLKWSGENKYWIDARGRVLKSEQSIHPMLERIEILFYYR